MNPLRIVLRNLRRRPLATGLTSLSVALGVGLFATVGALREAGERGFHRTAALCDQVVGAKGSPLTLVLNALYHMGPSPGNVPYSLYEEIVAMPGVQWAVPVAVGDAYQGARIVGVTDDFFRHVRLPGRSEEGDPLTFTVGAAFAYTPAQLKALKEELAAEEGEAAGAHEEEHLHPELARAVIGAEAAKSAHLRVGSRFHPAHDLTGAPGAPEHAEAECEVVGILAPTGTPVDRAIYVPIGLYYVIAGHAPTADTPAGGARDPRGLSAIYLRTKAGLHQIRIWRAINDRLDAQSARPADEVRNLFVFVSALDGVLRAISGLVVIVALAGVMVAVYNTMGARRREFAVYRALGARRSTLLGLVTAESAAIALLGGLLGLLLAALFIMLGAGAVRGITGVSIAAAPGIESLALLGGVTLAGAFAGLVPAAAAYRTEAARILSANV